MILLIDNYDSFVHNLARYFQRLGQDTRVVRNDAIDVAAIEALDPRAIVLSPGPGTPRQAGCSLEVVRRFHQRVPLLGVCLGHQVLAEALGGQIVRAPQPMHGRTSEVYHDAQGIYAGLPNPIVACRYHSLIVEEASLSDRWQVSARTAEGVVMGLRHRKYPVVGVQFHPESILTTQGYALLAAFLQRAGLPAPGEIPTIEQERTTAVDKATPLPVVPVTF